MEELSPKEYFNFLKEHVNTITDKELKTFENGCLSLVKKYSITGQQKIINKLKFLIDCVEKEKQIIDMGINRFVYRDDVEDYIDNISKDVVKIIELENYPRDIPDEIVDVIDKTKNIFDKMYVVFTDYTGNVEKTVQKERREKDPILFGTFQKIGEKFNWNNSMINDRFYFLGDWEDEYCDLTMDKFLMEAGKDKLNTTEIPLDTNAIKEELDRLSRDLNEMQDLEKINVKKKGIVNTFVNWVKRR